MLEEKKEFIEKENLQWVQKHHISNEDEFEDDE